MRRQKISLFSTLLSVMLLLAWAVPAYAAHSSSTNYQVNETFFGSGGAINVCSTNYCSNQSLGETAIGNPSSTNYQIHGGFNTTQQPYLYFVVNASVTNLGYLSTTSTATTTGTFSVRTYDAGGYSIETVSQPPSNGAGHTFATPSSPTAPSPGTEMFGMNLVANTSPTSFGSNPVLNPVAGSAVGAAASGYNTTNLFKYHVGDIVAGSTTPGNTTGEADYTVSYVFDINSGTPDGTYTFNDNLVATATY